VAALCLNSLIEAVAREGLDELEKEAEFPPHPNKTSEAETTVASESNLNGIFYLTPIY
jgi:hypothetical protein